MIDLLAPMTLPIIITSLCLFVIIQLFFSLSAETKTPENVPWLGKDSRKIFAESRAHFSSFVDYRKWITDGYENVRIRVLSLSAVRAETY